ncbi:MAG: SGNH/GDSL hydrolase family protein [Candidatus Omnitrophica bacterium]|nr:SGNH/GDSL hydrolase family protein [Candidatus Omnitrophota bacterium]
MNKELKFSIALFFCAIAVAFLMGEALVRWIGHFDGDGNFFVHSFKLYPYRVPLEKWNESIHQYLLSENSYLKYDPFLGWSPRPNSRSEDGLYSYNSDAIRTPASGSVISKIPDPGVLRIAIFGDSFTHGDDVSFEDTWGFFLENDLKKAGINAEVLNFGAGGYGMDQSFVRWRKTGHLYDPQIVIFGLQLENMNRNVSVSRAFYYSDTGIPFLKPRFILEQGALKLVNVPSPSPDEIIGIIRKFDAWEYSKYEYWYDKDRYQDHLFLRSKFLSFFYSLINEKFKKSLARKEDPEVLSLAIISKFKAEVESEGKIFCIVFLPARTDLTAPNVRFLRKIDEAATMIDTRVTFLKEADKLGAQALIPRHYSARGNEIVAEALTDFIVTMKR